MTDSGRAKHFSLDEYLAKKEGSFLAKIQTQPNGQAQTIRFNGNTQPNFYGTIKFNGTLRGRPKLQTLGERSTDDVKEKAFEANQETTPYIPETPFLETSIPCNETSCIPQNNSVCLPPSYSSNIRQEESNIDSLKTKVLELIADKTENGLSLLLSRLKQNISLLKEFIIFLKKSGSTYESIGKETSKISQLECESFKSLNAIIKSNFKIGTVYTNVGEKLFVLSEELTEICKNVEKSRKQIKEANQKSIKTIQESEINLNKAKTRLGKTATSTKDKAALTKRDSAQNIYEAQNQEYQTLSLQYEKTLLPKFLSTCIELDLELSSTISKNLTKYQQIKSVLCNGLNELCLSESVYTEVSMAKALKIDDSQDLLKFVQKMLPSTKKKMFGNNLAAIMQTGKLPEIFSKSFEFIEQRGLKLPGIYRISANPTTLEQLSKEFEITFQLPPATDVNLVASLVKYFLRELKEPLITSVLQPTTDLSEIPFLITKLPKCNHLVLKALILHLNKISNFSEYNKMNAGNLAIIFAPSIFGVKNEKDVKSFVKMTEFMISNPSIFYE